MILYFSGAKHYLSEQTDVNQSLGGFMSSTPIPNSRLDALFDGLSLYNLKNKVAHTIAIFLYNESNTKVENVTMTNVYQKLLNQNINLCDFEFSVIEPTDEGYIETIGNKNEEPFYVDWFTCESIRESVKIKIITAAALGENISILGNSGTITEFGTKESANKIFELASNDNDFLVERVSDDEILITRKSLDITNQNINFTTDGVMVIDNDTLSGGVDGNVLIADEIEPNKAIGIWMKRKISDNYKVLKGNDCVPLNEENLIKVESLELIFNYD